MIIRLKASEALNQLRYMRYYSVKRNLILPEPSWSIHSLLNKDTNMDLSLKTLKHLEVLSALNSSNIKNINEDINQLNHLFDILKEVKVEDVEPTARLSETQIIENYKERKIEPEYEIEKEGYFIV